MKIKTLSRPNQSMRHRDGYGFRPQLPDHPRQGAVGRNGPLFNFTQLTDIRRGTFTMKYAEYQQVPTDVQNKLLKEYEEIQKEE